MTDDSVVYRNIDELKLSPNVKQIAEGLLEQIDRPVVYLVNSQRDKNYSSRHPVYSNEYWVTVKPQTQQSEYDRLVLVGIYRALRDRKRLSSPYPTETYLKYIDSGTLEQQNNANIMIDRIVSFVTTVSISLMLPQEFKTSEEALQISFNDRIKKLKEYIQLQRTKNGFLWFKEIEICNLLDYVNFCYRNDHYKETLLKLIIKVKPTKKAYEYIANIKYLSNAINEIISAQNEKSIEEIENDLFNLVLDRFKLRDKICLQSIDVENGDFTLPDGRIAKHYAFVPEKIENENLIVKGIRYSREFISILQEHKNINSVNITVDLILDSEFHAYANGNKNAGYYISLSTGLFVELNSYLQDRSLDYIKCYMSDEEIKEQLFKYVVFLVTAHEFAHILNGDCDSVIEVTEQVFCEQDEKADKFALKLVSELFMFSYDEHYLINNPNEFSEKFFIKCFLLKKAAHICFEHFCNRGIPNIE